MSNLIFPSVPGAIYERGTPMYRESVQEADSGVEYRIKQWSRPRYRHSIRWSGLRRAAAYQEAQTVASFLCRHAARHESFLFRDPWDNAATDHGFGVGDGSSTKFPLQRAMGGRHTDRLGTWDVYTKPRTNRLLRSQEFDNASWTKRGACSVAGNTLVAPDGTLTADHVSGIGAIGLDDLFQGQVGFVAGEAVTPSVWVSRVSTSGTLVVQSPYGAAYGRWNVDLAALGSGWRRLTPTTAGVTVVTTFSAFSSGGGGIHLYASSGGPISFDLWGAQVESGSTATAYIPTTSAAARSETGYWTSNQSTGALVVPSSSSYFEPITEPDWLSVTLYMDGVALVPGTDFTFTAAGLVTFAVAPAAGAILSWTGTYHKRVRFDDEEPDFERVAGDIVCGGSIDLVTVI